MPTWERQHLLLEEDHGWASEPDCQVVLIDRGAVRFDIPRSWTIEPGENGTVTLRENASPSEKPTLELTVFYLNEGLDWSGLPVSRLVSEIGSRPSEPHFGPPLEVTPVREFRRDGMSAAWSGRRYFEENREVSSRLLIARKWNIQTKITYAFWSDPDRDVQNAWEILVRTLTLGDYVEVPTRRL